MDYAEAGDFCLDDGDRIGWGDEALPGRVLLGARPTRASSGSSVRLQILAHLPGAVSAAFS